MSVYAEKRQGSLTGRWVAEVQVDGRIHKARFDSKKEANGYAADIKVGRVPQALAKAKDIITLGEAGHQALRTRWRDSRDPAIFQRVNDGIKIVGPNLKVTEVKTRDLDRLVDALRDRGCSLGTINRYLSAVSGVLGWAKEREYLEALPRVPWLAEGSKEAFYYTPEETAQLEAHFLEKGEADLALVYRVLELTGMRLGELCALAPEHVEQVGETWWVRIWQNKANLPRSMTLPESYGRALKELCERGMPQAWRIRHHLSFAVKRLGLREGLNVHSFRHTTGINLVKLGVNTRIIQTVLGHSSVKTTERYTQVNNEMVEEAGRVLAEGLAKNLVTLAKVQEAKSLILQEKVEASEGIEPPYTDLQSACVAG